jgi:hypothetical protein
MAKVRINHLAVETTALRLTTPLVRTVCRETKELSQRWPRSGNPAYTYPPTGNLYRQTYFRVRERKSGPFGVVGNDSPIALAVHNGTKGHWIRIRTKKFMKFRWKRMGGNFFYFKIVWHRPLKGNHFLTEPMRIVAARHGFIVRKTGPL